MLFTDGTRTCTLLTMEVFAYDVENASPVHTTNSLLHFLPPRRDHPSTIVVCEYMFKYQTLALKKNAFEKKSPCPTSDGAGTT